MARVALVQTTSSDDFQANLAHALARVDEAAALGVDMVAFPEVFLYIGGAKGKLANAQALNGAVVQQFRDKAARNKLWILLGSLHEKIPGREDKVANTSVLIDAQGKIAAHYRKMKLFDVELAHLTLKESDTIVPGDVLPPVVETPLGQTALTICFDLRFGELYQHARRKGAEVIFVPSNFTHPTGAAHWETMLKARAIENQVYIAAPAQWGQHNPKFTSWGHTALVDPWGTVTALAPDRPGITVGEVDLEFLRKVRRELPMGVGA
jgi:predicted amidohydrolase